MLQIHRDRRRLTLALFQAVLCGGAAHGFRSLQNKHSLVIAAVSMLWGDGTAATCTTSSTGACTVSRSNILSGVMSPEVTNVTKTDYLYDPASNDETSITVNKP